MMYADPVRRAQVATHIARRAYLAMIVAAVVCAHAGASPASEQRSAERRVALVMGNSAYGSAPVLPNPRRDAQAMAAALKRLGFDVELRIDGIKAQMDDAIRRFGDRLEGAQVGLFFYAGHGLQFNGVNYLVPVDAKLAKERDLDFEGLELARVLKQMETQRRVNLVFLDACRDNPLSRSLARNLGAKRSLVGRGLAPVDAAVGTLIAYATKDGDVAEDGAGNHSPYTQALLAHLEKPGVEIGLLLRRVREQVLKATGGTQVPWEYGSLVGEFYFVPPPSAPEIAAGAAPVAAQRPTTRYPRAQRSRAGTAADVEIEYWNSVKDSADPLMLRAYLKRYPNGSFADLAKLRLDDLQRSSAQQPSSREPRTDLSAQARPADSAGAPQPKAELVQSPPAPPIGSSPGTVFNDRLKDGSAGPDMVVIPAGRFWMGSSEGDQGCDPSEIPRHEVILDKPFALGKYEVSVAQFRAFVRATGYRTDAERLGSSWVYQGKAGHWNKARGMSWRHGYTGAAADDKLPVTHVSWGDARAYTSWLSEQTDAQFRLPSEAELEYANRAGSQTLYWWGDGRPWKRVGNLAGERDRSPEGGAWTESFSKYGDEYWGPAPVGQFEPNPFGLYDTAGNVSEWAQDCWNGSYQGAPANGSAWQRGDCGMRVFRGGSWATEPNDVRCAKRFANTPDYRSAELGFRLARNL